MKALRAAHRTQGFTIIELLVVVAIISVLSFLAAPKLTQYRLREDARSLADAYRGALSEARSLAIARGRPHYVLFNAPAIPEWEDDAIALIVDDADSSFNISTGDAFTSPAKRLSSAEVQVGLYGVGSQSTEPFKDATPPSGDQSAPVDLETLSQGSSFDTDPSTGVPAVAFTTQGIPVSMQTPNNFGSGAGAIYVTDNAGLVFAVILEPLGAVRIRALRPGTSEWY